MSEPKPPPAPPEPVDPKVYGGEWGATRAQTPSPNTPPGAPPPPDRPQPIQPSAEPQGTANDDDPQT